MIINEDYVRMKHSIYFLIDLGVTPEKYKLMYEKILDEAENDLASLNLEQESGILFKKIMKKIRGENNNE